jgi:hypothetical protein
LKKYQYALLGLLVGLLLAEDAFGPPNFAVNAGILALMGLLMVGLSMNRSVRVPNWSATAPRQKEPSEEGVVAMASWIKDAAGGGYGSRIKIARILSTVYAVNEGATSDSSLVSGKGRELVDKLLEKEPWAEPVFRPNPEGGMRPRGSGYLSALEGALALVSKGERL